jgi:hypothetical protein
MPPLTPVEREAITDSVLKIQSIQASLDQVENQKIPEMTEILKCLRAAYRSLRTALQQAP